VTKITTISRFRKYDFNPHPHAEGDPLAVQR